MIEIKYIAPELSLAISIFSLLIMGVFIKNSFNIIYRLSSLSLLLILAIVLSGNFQNIKIFNDSILLDNFSVFMKTLILITSFFILAISKKYLIDIKNNKFEYPIIVLLSILGMFIMVSANDLIVFYLGLELQSLSLYILAAIDRDNSKSSEAGIKYFVLSALSSGLLLYVCSLLYGFTGATNFDLIAQNLDETNSGAVFGIVFIIVGLAFKVSAVPFHMWTPDVYEGSPTSVTVFFALIPKIAAFSIFIRFMYVPFVNMIDQWQLIIVFLAIGSMILGAVAAIGQNNIKRLMAYSSIGHIGYALAGLSTGTNAGVQSTIIYLVIYLFMNLSVFGCIFMMKREGNFLENINDLSGLSKNHPLLALCFLISLFSLAGIPPLAGFFAKFYIFMSVIESKMYALAIIGLLTTVISAFYYLRIIKIIYFDKPKKPFENTTDLGLRASLVMATIAILIYFIYPSTLINIVSSITF